MKKLLTNVEICFIMIMVADVVVINLTFFAPEVISIEGDLFFYFKTFLGVFQKNSHFKMKKAKRKSRKYSPEFKICVILDKLNNNLSRNETVRKYWHTTTKRDTKRYTNRVSDWERIYLKEGELGLKKDHRAQRTKMEKPKRGRPRKAPIPQKADSDLVEENKRLRERNEWLEMENEYLKKLDALIRAEEAKNGKKPK